ncbi:hypothetical protein MPLB_1390016 [Mesorhizobium sp. ORS 3324]|nr:hypothetical protein MPLB_1390016 [Mesorhizobium sp. ORS 3324]
MTSSPAERHKEAGPELGGDGRLAAEDQRRYRLAVAVLFGTARACAKRGDLHRRYR